MWRYSAAWPPSSAVDQRVGDQLSACSATCVVEVADRPATASARGRRSAATASARRQAAQMVADLVPGALVLRLFLAPDHFRRLGEALEFGSRAARAGTDTAARRARWRRRRAPRFARVLEQVVVDLAASTRTTRRAFFGVRWWCPRSGAGSCRWPVRPASTPPACGAAATSASSPPAACAWPCASAGGACGTSAPAWSACRPACCRARTAAGSAPGAPSCARGPGLRSRAAGTAPGRTGGPTWTSPEVMNWSITTCAPLAKSPNWPSQMSSVVGLGGGVAVLERHHRFLADSSESMIDRVLGVLHQLAQRQVVRRRSPGRAAPRGGGRRCRGRSPGRPGAACSLRRAGSRRRGSRRSPSRIGCSPAAILRRSS